MLVLLFHRCLAESAFGCTAIDVQIDTAGHQEANGLEGNIV